MVTPPAATEPPVGSVCADAQVTAPTSTAHAIAIPTCGGRRANCPTNLKSGISRGRLTISRPCRHPAGTVDRRSILFEFGSEICASLSSRPCAMPRRERSLVRPSKHSKIKRFLGSFQSRARSQNTRHTCQIAVGSLQLRGFHTSALGIVGLSLRQPPRRDRYP